MGLLSTILRLGRIAEPAAAPPVRSHVDVGSRTSLHVRHVDAGSCNGCEVELSGCFSPVYDAEQYGIRLVASPRHADALLVTGVVTRNLSDALLATVEATPRPRAVVAVGDCACDGGGLLGAYGVLGPVRAVVAPDVEIPGCPPHPSAIIAALRSVTGR
ncbi:MAG: NADH-quinone oxidoreductase subunit B family protein [Actinomycetota bacterium]|nr:NADH-quinone oxidoreductase subunit B family protein [Actinomycetota bacterium]